MKDPTTALQAALGKQLNEEGYDVVDMTLIPARGDRMVRIRTLEEALDEYDDQGASGETTGYIVQVRPRRDIFSQMVDETFAHAQASAAARMSDSPAAETKIAPKPSTDGIYLPSGKVNMPYLMRNAELLYSSGEYALARNIYKTVLASGENSAIALYWMGRCLEAEAKFEEAEKHYEESVTYYPNIDAYQHFAALLIRRKKDHQAAEVMERALSLKGLTSATSFELHKACGNCWMRAERATEAERHYRKALELDPSADSIQANLGALYLTLGKNADARKCFQNALASNPRNDRALAGLGSCSMASGEKRAAHDYFAKALELNLNNPTAVYYLVKCAYEIRSYATAARLVEEYVEIAPVNPNLMYSLAGLQFHLGRVEAAQVTARRIIEMKPGHAGAGELLKMIDRYSGN